MTDLCHACKDAAHQCDTHGGCPHSGCPWVALTKAEARVVELEAALRKAAILDVGRLLPRDGSEADFVDGVNKGQDKARDYVKAIAAPPSPATAPGCGPW